MSDAIVRALVPCHLAFQDLHHRWNLIGTFEQINVSGLPTTYDFQVYLRASDVPRKGVIRLDVKDPADNLNFSTGAFPYEISKEKGLEVEHVTQLRQVPFIEPGQHRLEAYFGGTLAGSWPIMIKPKQEPTE